MSIFNTIIGGNGGSGGVTALEKHANYSDLVLNGSANDKILYQTLDTRNVYSYIEGSYQLIGASGSLIYANLAAFPVVGINGIIYIADDTQIAYYYHVGTYKMIVGNINDKGWFINPTALQTAYPTGQNGWFAVVGSTDTMWVWDSDSIAWKDSYITPDAPVKVDFTITSNSSVNIPHTRNRKVLVQCYDNSDEEIVLKIQQPNLSNILLMSDNIIGGSLSGYVLYY